MQKLFIIILIVLSSCYSPRYVYSPVTQNIPMLNKKNDVQIAGYISGGTSGTVSNSTKNAYNLGIDLHFAYSFSDHFAAMINQYNRWEKNSSNNDVFVGDSIIIKYKRSLTEIGGGYYSTFNNQNTCFQFFTGVAVGKFSITEGNAQNRSSAGRFHSSNITKFFIQPVIISGMAKNFTTAFSSRFSMIYYNNVSTDYSAAELNNYFLSDLSQSPVFFWEPSMSYVFGFKRIRGVKLEAQLGMSVLKNRRFVDYRTLNMALGLTSDLKWKPIVKRSKPDKTKEVNQN